MPENVLQKGWLAALVASEIERHDPAAAAARLPADVRDAGDSSVDLAPGARLLVARSLRRRHIEAEPPEPAAAFQADVRLHVALLLDLGVLRGDAFDPARRRSEIAAFLAAALGLPDLALAVRVDQPGAASARAAARALRGTEQALQRRFFPPGDPRQGLPLHPGHVAVLRRRIARVAMGFHRHGHLDPAALARHANYALHETVLLAETIAGLMRSAAPVDVHTLVVRQRQLARLGLPRPSIREARRAVAGPRPPAEIAAAAPERVRPFLVEQLFLAVMRAHLSGDGPRAFVEAFSEAARLDPAALAAARVEAAAQHGDHLVWFEAFEEGGSPDWQALADEWESTADQLVERVSSAVTGNLGAMVKEIRETGELGQLLAKAAAGRGLTADEKRKVRAQLLDVAKAVPALAIFAAPGGMLLLPLLAKLLPFNLLPSAWDKPGPKGPGPKSGGSAG